MAFIDGLKETIKTLGNAVLEGEDSLQKTQERLLSLQERLGNARVTLEKSRIKNITKQNKYL